eukprot:169212-Chlamydomonas_euryale.AAC.3
MSSPLSARPPTRDSPYATCPPAQQLPEASATAQGESRVQSIRRALLIDGRSSNPSSLLPTASPCLLDVDLDEGVPFLRALVARLRLERGVRRRQLQQPVHLERARHAGLLAQVAVQRLQLLGAQLLAQKAHCVLQLLLADDAVVVGVQKPHLAADAALNLVQLSLDVGQHTRHAA